MKEYDKVYDKDYDYKKDGNDKETKIPYDDIGSKVTKIVLDAIGEKLIKGTDYNIGSKVTKVVLGDVALEFTTCVDNFDECTETLNVL
ncbi:MAG: hypothetical protein O7161_05220 [Wolbachia endosymbiont of Halictus tumulorum]|nr:hypothetical protein [Wolbachia endosymbiont of Halictus tumulorum]